MGAATPFFISCHFPSAIIRYNLSAVRHSLGFIIIIYAIKRDI
ncbi:hypothetical protein NT01EI_0195 [Edwardsiella ictaluri 93-146]|uniref:Uncharacterized protein n=1 Tax=Edwardsiella ictaluri (strain 93-146) TaxID=634503 RepID=C5B6X6_EDWI9|nr:hypothetical protein NT01EI_0195 [Edwardsiella ictaluri 93-146]